MTRRYLVVFRSHPAPPSDVTIVDVRASGELHAIATARREMPPHHPWAIATARPWPRGCATVEQAMSAIA